MLTPGHRWRTTRWRAPVWACACQVRWCRTVPRIPFQRSRTDDASGRRSHAETAAARAAVKRDSRRAAVADPSRGGRVCIDRLDNLALGRRREARQRHDQHRVAPPVL
eukprot:482034-Prymnesium_polylepis.1